MSAPAPQKTESKPEPKTEPTLPPRGERLAFVKIAATAADGLPLTGPNSAESSLRARTNPKSSGWDLWFQAEEQRILLEKYEGEQLVKRFAIPHAGAKFYEIV